MFLKWNNNNHIKKWWRKLIFSNQDTFLLGAWFLFLGEERGCQGYRGLAHDFIWDGRCFPPSWLYVGSLYFGMGLAREIFRKRGTSKAARVVRKDSHSDTILRSQFLYHLRNSCSRYLIPVAYDGQKKRS